MVSNGSIFFFQNKLLLCDEIMLKLKKKQDIKFQITDTENKNAEHFEWNGVPFFCC